MITAWNVNAAVIPSFEVIDTANDEFTLRIKEVIYIKKFEPNLKKQINNLGSFYLCKF